MSFEVLHFSFLLSFFFFFFFFFFFEPLLVLGKTGSVILTSVLLPLYLVP